MHPTDLYASDPQMCRQCGGLCCQGHPGLWTVPEDFFALFYPEESPSSLELKRRLPEIGLRLRDLDGILIPTPEITPSGCIFLGETGCKLPVSNRPEQCRALTPNLDTLINGEMCCTLPADHGSGTARERWGLFWHNRQLEKQ